MTVSPSSVHPQRQLVAARGVHVVHLGRERLAQAAAARVLVVVQDDLLVERLELHHATPKKLCACRTAATRSSTSRGSL